MPLFRSSSRSAPSTPAPGPTTATATHAPIAAGNGAPGPQGDETPFRGPIESVLRHPVLTLVPVVLLVALALVVGLTRSAEHTAEARINVGRADVPAYTLQGVTIGNATLAASYARAIEAPEVVESAARAAGISPEAARTRLAGSQIPQSTLIRVEAEGPSSAQAQALANGAAEGLIRYVTRLNARQQDTAALRRYREAQRRTDRARRKYARLSARRSRTSPAVQEARIDLLSAQLRSQSLSTRVVQGAVAAPAPNLLQLIVPAATARSDAGSVLQRLVLLGLGAGLLIGVALALLRANSSLLRRPRA